MGCHCTYKINTVQLPCWRDICTCPKLLCDGIAAFSGLLSALKLDKSSGRAELSATRIREIVLENLTALGLNAKQFGLHSLRSGGASAAANAGVPDRMFKRHGRWRSENAKDGYVKYSLKDPGPAQPVRLIRFWPDQYL